MSFILGLVIGFFSGIATSVYAFRYIMKEYGYEIVPGKNKNEKNKKTD